MKSSVMKKKLFPLLLIFFSMCTQPQNQDQPEEAQPTTSSFLSGILIDLTYTFDSSTIYWPTEEGFILNQAAEGYTEKGYYYTANSFCGAEHGGTHLDAPIHFAEGRQTVDAIPLQNLIGPGVVIDVSEVAADNPDYQISVGDFEQWEATYGKIPEGTIVLLRTGYGRYWPDRVRYMGTDARGTEGVAQLHFPGLHPDAARWLIENRAIKAIGLDTPSIDYGQSQLFETHQTLFKENIPAFENVAHMDELPIQGFTIIALPMKIGGGSGAPLRIIAVVPEGL
jgi:kynurenine formamidase